MYYLIFSPFYKRHKICCVP